MTGNNHFWALLLLLSHITAPPFHYCTCPPALPLLPTHQRILMIYWLRIRPLYYCSARGQSDHKSFCLSTCRSFYLTVSISPICFTFFRLLILIYSSFKMFIFFLLKVSIYFILEAVNCRDKINKRESKTVPIKKVFVAVWICSLLSFWNFLFLLFFFFKSIGVGYQSTKRLMGIAQIEKM